jgi:hypothetical protein
VTVDYELIYQKNVWKVNGPTIDYPDINAATLLRQLSGSAADSKKNAKMRERINDVANKIKSAATTQK